jgi:hypothetical protein
LARIEQLKPVGGTEACSHVTRWRLSIGNSFGSARTDPISFRKSGPMDGGDGTPRRGFATTLRSLFARRRQANQETRRVQRPTRWPGRPSIIAATWKHAANGYHSVTPLQPDKAATAHALLIER